MTNAEYLRIQRRMWIAMHQSMMMNNKYCHSEVNQIMSDADDIFWKMEEQDIKEKLCWLLDTYSDAGKWSDGWISEKRKKEIKLKELVKMFGSHKNKLCRLLGIENKHKEPTLKDILEAVRELKHKKRGIYIVKK